MDPEIFEGVWSGKFMSLSSSVVYCSLGARYVDLLAFTCLELVYASYL